MDKVELSELHDLHSRVTPPMSTRLIPVGLHTTSTPASRGSLMTNSPLSPKADTVGES